MKQPKLHRTYFGINIWWNDKPGYSLRWTGGGYAADTLAGLKAIIKDALKSGDIYEI